MGKLRIRLLPVGLGDCTLLRFSDESWAVVDCGGDPSAAEQAAAFLQTAPPRGRPVRFILATHPDVDHIGGMPRLLASLELCDRRIEAFYHCGVERLLDGGAQRGPLDYVREAEDHHRRGRIGRVAPLQAGDVIDLKLEPPEPDLEIRVLNPAQARVNRGPARSAADRNNVSIVLQFQAQGVCVLLTGDVQESAWTDVIARPDLESPRVLKVPHHGSINGKPPQAILDQTAPDRWAILSTPSGDEDLPHQDTLGALWDASWTTRCTGWSPHCDPRDQKRYPMPPGGSTCPESLRLALQFVSDPRRLQVQYYSRVGCCVENELVIDGSGGISHSRQGEQAKTCDYRRGTPSSGRGG